MGAWHKLQDSRSLRHRYISTIRDCRRGACISITNHIPIVFMQSYRVSLHEHCLHAHEPQKGHLGTCNRGENPRTGMKIEIIKRSRRPANISIRSSLKYNCLVLAAETYSHCNTDMAMRGTYLRAAIFATVLAAVFATQSFTMPREHRGLRCTTPFCDFTCLRSDSGTRFGDVGGDIDITEEIVRKPASIVASIY